MALKDFSSEESAKVDYQIERVGDVIGRYKLLEKIGEGGFGVVFMAEQVEPVQRKVALKIVKAGMDTKEVIARFEAERQAIALMDHPNIARALDASATETGRSYFVMELVRGIPITDYCDQNQLSTRDRLQLFIKVCQAVQHAHQKGVIHRDLKPSNVLVTLYDGEPVPKVIDFGVAKALGQKLTEKTLFTAFHHLIGTPAYMSPEQAALSGLDVDTRADIYSLGVLLYELLTGATPFDAETFREAGLDEIRRMIRETEPPKPSTRLNTLGEKLTEVARRRDSEPATLSRLVRGDLDWIVMKCLEKDRRRRYETASSLATDVARHLKSEPVFARPPSNLYRLQKMVRRHSVVFAASGAVTGALLIGLAVSTRLYFQEKKALFRADQERRRADQALVVIQAQTAEQFFVANETSKALAYMASVLRLAATNEVIVARAFTNLTQQLLAIPLVQPLGHDGPVYFAHFSPDGSKVVTGSADGSARVWDVDSGKQLTPTLHHTGAVWMVQFSPNGQKVVTASEDKTARIWDARTGVELTPPLEHPCGVGYVYFSPDGLRMLTGTWEPYWEMRIWDVQTGRPVSPAIPDVHRLRCPPFNRNGTQIVSTWHTNAVMVWDGLTGAPLIGPFKHDMHVWAAEFSPNGQQFVSAGHDGNVCIWNVPTNRSSDFAVKPPITTAKIEDGRAPQGPVHRLPHGKPLWLARFSPNGERVFTICNDMTIQLWDAATGRALTGPLTYADEDNLESYHEMVGPYRGERSAVFSSDSKMILMAFGDRPLLLDGMNSRILTEPLKHKIVRSAEFSKDNQRVVTASLEGSARIWGVRAGWPSSLSADHRNQRELPGLTPVPSWVPTLLEAIAEKRLNERGEIEPASPEILFSLKTQLIESTASDVWTRWGKWLFSGSATTNATAQKPVE